MFTKKNEIKPGEWITIAPEGAVNAFEGSWHGYIKKGSLNKVIVYFWGGGVAYDEYSMRHPDGYFFTQLTTLEQQISGITDDVAENPFRDWTYIMLPYTTGDFHAGDGEYVFKEEDGSEKTLRCHGYKNYRSFLDLAVEYLDETPESVLVTGCSAGGFAASILASDVIKNYFPTVKDTAAFVDSAILVDPEVKSIAETVWQTPKEISDRLVTGDLVLDSLKALANDLPDTKILFTMSARDGIITSYQHYIVRHDRDFPDEYPAVITGYIKLIVDWLNGRNNTSFFIWDDFPCPYFPAECRTTDHTIASFDRFYKEKLGNDKVTVADWLVSCLSGDFTSHGYELLLK